MASGDIAADPTAVVDPANAYGGSLLGMGVPFTISLLTSLLGVILMILQWRAAPAFFRRKLETASPDLRL
jgi:hypothetical protein